MIKKKVMGFLNGKNLFLIFFFRNDGRKYKGCWKNGKQHGEGEFLQNANSVWRRGLWSEGKRVRWVNDTKNNHPEIS